MKEKVTEENIELIDEVDNSDDAESQVYEIGFHIVSTVEEEKVASEFGLIKSLIEKSGGTIISDEYPKLVELAYEIKKSIEGKNQVFSTAYFGWIKFEMKTSNVAVFKEEVDINKNILRYLIIKTVKESTITPKNAVFSETSTPKKKKIKTALEVDDIKEKSESKMTEAELDKTIEELILD